MTATTDTAEGYLPRGLAWHEPDAMPLLADYECGGCGYLQTAEVIACSCGFTATAAGGLASTGTTVTVVRGHRVVRRGR